jgi:hypothetical protein
VNLRQGETVHLAIPALNSYLGRKAGDTVTVVRSNAGWCVIGKVGPEWVPDPEDELDLSWGTGSPPGSGWVSGTAWARDGAVYVQTADPAPPPKVLHPRPVTLSPSSQAAYRDGLRDGEQNPSQGCWHSYPHPYTGGWFYGSQISDACSGKSVASMTIRIARTAEDHGIYGGVKPVLYLLTPGSAPTTTPSLGAGPFYGPALALGVSATFSLPASFATALAAGTASGVGISAGVGDSSYLIATSGCGQITVTFN